MYNESKELSSVFFENLGLPSKAKTRKPKTERCADIPAMSMHKVDGRTHKFQFNSMAAELLGLGENPILVNISLGVNTAGNVTEGFGIITNSPNGYQCGKNCRFSSKELHNFLVEKYNLSMDETYDFQLTNHVVNGEMSGVDCILVNPITLMEDSQEGVEGTNEQEIIMEVQEPVSNDWN